MSTEVKCKNVKLIRRSGAASTMGNNPNSTKYDLFIDGDNRGCWDVNHFMEFIALCAYVTSDRAPNVDLNVHGQYTLVEVKRILKCVAKLVTAS